VLVQAVVQDFIANIQLPARHVKVDVEAPVDADHQTQGTSEQRDAAQEIETGVGMTGHSTDISPERSLHTGMVAYQTACRAAAGVYP
jgi:hypothetical protein